jgi:hypothetical protein
MKAIARRVKKLLEAAKPGITVVELSGTGKRSGCPIGEALWLEYRRRNPNGVTFPPSQDCNTTDPELLAYLQHVDVCHDCAAA